MMHANRAEGGADIPPLDFDVGGCSSLWRHRAEEYPWDRLTPSGSIHPLFRDLEYLRRCSHLGKDETNEALAKYSATYLTIPRDSQRDRIIVRAVYFRTLLKVNRDNPAQLLGLAGSELRAKCSRWWAALMEQGLFYLVIQTLLWVTLAGYVVSLGLRIWGAAGCPGAGESVCQSRQWAVIVQFAQAAVIIGYLLVDALWRAHRGSFSSRFRF